MSKKPVGHKARKRFGQNFLQDQGIIRRIIRAIAPGEEHHLVEIGPGLGAITEEILPLCQRLDVVELDRDLIPILRTKFFSYEDKFTIHEGDALKFDFSSLQQADEQLRVVGNLPYNISTPLIFHLLSHADLIEDMHFMLQKEVVDRLAAQPGESAYGRLGIMAQYFCQVEPLFLVPPYAFDPAPKVDSAIVRLVPYKQLPHKAKDYTKLEVVVRTAFGQRRKTLRNNLKPLLSGDEINDLGIDPGLRPERLALEDFIKISDYLSDKQ
ncbi:16S rRNA (adenine(1518)-N(6)/adenine(1519)-N(6))-dimethyltransferase RsmA [Amphritea balenae]|uniref:Ribosomal RNA small subunit methyltransferase A n=1 Tax=Amphritea balenae TaxID=452629 RepID=A0A3P1SR96_9GAMM|nr:16S rRNA (adenine(1518)-N(6)/adenine(1519)-N(6))-dimethyltransferase RsmA [Amphritea balenae]RRC99165.1 16S rRNA (adenine(1518)-N(6)/adenine(1519)-N(6))-dimethyltransferase RsmA [Amphritea balenae]GGK73385.1 ribosomal RNA small subunit methyltransferase A [Amphritea balenae]